MSPIATKLLTAEEFAERHGGDHAELIDGWVKELSVAQFPQGVLNVRFATALAHHVEEHDLGWVTSNDTFVLTRRNPDRVRGADVAYWSYQRVPKGPMPVGLVTPPPELVAEVRSPSDRWVEIGEKVQEYLRAGVNVVVVFDPPAATATVFRIEEFPQVLDNGDELLLPDILPEFAVKMARFFRDVAG